MIKYIYKITNLINNKCYIGQAKDYKVRFYAHKNNLKRNKHENQYLQNAWNKYGEENFLFEVIDSGENYNELEKHYIKLYNSTKREYGYNILSGGENPPIQAAKKLDLEQVKDIQSKLLNNVLIEDILKEYCFITRGQVCRINSGDAWFDSNLVYPLKPVEHKIDNETIQNIICDLKETKIKQKDIAKKYNLSRTAITAINNGTGSHYIEGIDYPIRKSRCVGTVTDDEKIVDQIICDLLETQLSFDEIANKYNISSYATIRDINIGRGRHYRSNMQYPIR